MAGGEVILCDFVVVVTSLHPQIYPGVLQSAEGEDGAGEVEVGSLQPNHPGVLHEFVGVFVDVGMVVLVLVLMGGVDVSSLQPNHPGVLQVDVVVVVVLVEVTRFVVVVSSKHPHQPGVWHVDVRVLGFVEVDELDVEVLVLLPVTSFQSGQS
jgi:hypothetical protein